MGDIAIARCPRCSGFMGHCKCCQHKPIVEPVPEPIPEPVVEPIPEPVVLTPEPIAEPIPEPVPEPIPEPEIDFAKVNELMEISKRMQELQVRIDAKDREREIVQREKAVLDDVMKILESTPKMLREDNLESPAPPKQHIEPVNEPVKVSLPSPRIVKTVKLKKKKAPSEAFRRLTATKKVNGKSH